MWDWIGQVMNGLNSLAGLAGQGMQMWNFFNPPNQQQPLNLPPQQGGGFNIEFPDMSEWMAGMMEMMNQKPEPDYKSLAKAYTGAKSNMAERGLYSGGAVTPEALAAMMGVDDPDLIYKALKDQGMEV